MQFYCQTIVFGHFINWKDLRKRYSPRACPRNINIAKKSHCTPGCKPGPPTDTCSVPHGLSSATHTGRHHSFNRLVVSHVGLKTVLCSLLQFQLHFCFESQAPRYCDSSCHSTKEKGEKSWRSIGQIWSYWLRLHRRLGYQPQHWEDDELWWGQKWGCPLSDMAILESSSAPLTCRLAFLNWYRAPSSSL